MNRTEERNWMEQMHRIREQIRPDEQLMEATRMRIRQPERIYRFTFWILLIPGVLLILGGIFYFFAYARPTSDDLMKRALEFEEAQGRYQQEWEKEASKSEYFSQELQDRLIKQYEKLLSQYVKKDSSLYKVELDSMREDLKCDQTEYWKEIILSPEEEKQEEQELSEVAERAGLSAAELEHLKLYGRETKVNEKAEYRIGYRKAYITFWSRIRLSDEDNTVTVSEMKISYTFERLDGCWKISGTNIEAI